MKTLQDVLDTLEQMGVQPNEIKISRTILNYFVESITGGCKLDRSGG